MLLYGTIAMAKVSGPCADCHTMHNMQGGNELYPNGPYGALTKGDCIGCHMRNDGDTLGGTLDQIPIVYNAQDPNYGVNGTDGDTLAGGNFYWVVTKGNEYGHNVEGIPGVTFDMSPPGFDGGRPDAEGNKPANGTWPSNQMVTCAGLYGCHGRHTEDDNWASIRGAHHADDTTIDGNTVGTSYRFLIGILGKEDDDWEYKPDSLHHNQYKGIHRTDDQNYDSSTISYLCAECHGEFHNGNGNVGDASPWLRHPTDFDLGAASGSEYASYNGGTGTGNTYSVVAPVASVDVSNVLDKVNPGSTDGTAIVMCISCHRAHGTPYKDLLRWPYLPDEGGQCTVGGGSGGCGCLICHTEKGTY